MSIYLLDRAWLMRKGTVLLIAILSAITLALLRGPAFRTAAADPADLPLTRADSPDDRVALTFDVTWQKQELTRILEILESHQVKATFFVGGTFLHLYPEMVKEIARRGHEVGTLGQKMQDLTGMPETEIVSNLLGSQSALAKILGGPVRYFRPPHGPASPEVVRAARQARLVTVTYSLDGQDYLERSAEQIARRVVRGARRGDIIRLTASDWSKETARALPAIIQGLKERNFQLVRLSELVPVQ
ncbi:MAG: polysaccharide deacetylase family protein [Pseudomonadota bacterium]